MQSGEEAGPVWVFRVVPGVGEAVLGSVFVGVFKQFVGTESLWGGTAPAVGFYNPLESS